MTVEERIQKLERQNHRLLVILLIAAVVGIGALAALPSGTIRADKIIIGEKGLDIETGTGTRLFSFSQGATGGVNFRVYDANGNASVALLHNVYSGGALQIFTDYDGGSAAGAVLWMNESGGELRLYTRHFPPNCRAVLATQSEEGAILTTYSGSGAEGVQDIVAEWP